MPASYLAAAWPRQRVGGRLCAARGSRAAARRRSSPRRATRRRRPAQPRRRRRCAPRRPRTCAPNASAPPASCGLGIQRPPNSAEARVRRRVGGERTSRRRRPCGPAAEPIEPSAAPFPPRATAGHSGGLTRAALTGRPVSVVLEAGRPPTLPRAVLVRIRPRRRAPGRTVSWRPRPVRRPAHRRPERRTRACSSRRRARCDAAGLEAGRSLVGGGTALPTLGPEVRAALSGWRRGPSSPTLPSAVRPERQHPAYLEELQTLLDQGVAVRIERGARVGSATGWAGGDGGNVFEDASAFDRPVAAASVGRVYRAKLKPGGFRTNGGRLKIEDDVAVPIRLPAFSGYYQLPLRSSASGDIVNAKDAMRLMEAEFAKRNEEDRRGGGARCWTSPPAATADGGNTGEEGVGRRGSGDWAGTLRAVKSEAHVHPPHDELPHGGVVCRDGESSTRIAIPPRCSACGPSWCRRC